MGEDYLGGLKSNRGRLSCFSLNSSATGNGSFFSAMFGSLVAYSALITLYSAHFSGRSDSGKIALVGQTGSQAPQSMHSSGWMTRKLAPLLYQYTGHTETQSVYLHLTQGSVTTN